MLDIRMPWVYTKREVKVIFMSNATPQVETLRTTFRLPQPLHKAIRLEAAETDRAMTDIIIEQLSQRYAENGSKDDEDQKPD